MSTYDMILAEGIKIGIEKGRQRVEEQLEEARQQVNKVILYLYQIDQKTPEEIALIVSKDLAYVETLISYSEEENIADN